MTHTIRRSPLVSMRIFAAGIAVCMLGCAPDETNDVTSATEALSGRFISIYYMDNRSSPSVQVGITAVDQSNGGFYGGSAFVPGPMNPAQTINTTDSMKWSQDGLSQYSYPITPPGRIVIDDVSAAPHRFTKMTVTVTANINGSCHTDSEVIDLTNSAYLSFDGRGASWNGRCWVGNLLRVMP